MIDANFFWHGSELSLYEKACLTSFVDCGADVFLHTFNLELGVPPGVTITDASRLAHIDEVHAYTQGGHTGSVAAFSDIIRYRILSKRTGWWFDTDVFCLHPVEKLRDLESQSPGLIVGHESPGRTNGAVMCISDCSVAESLSQLANSKGKLFKWGTIGPKLIAEYALLNADRVRIMDQRAFYPIPLASAVDVLVPELAERCKVVCENALTLHLWNEYFRRIHLPKTLMPPVGSYLWNLFSRVDVRVEPNASLALDAFLQLKLAGQLSRLDYIALGVSSALKKASTAVLRKRK